MNKSIAAALLISALLAQGSIVNAQEATTSESAAPDSSVNEPAASTTEAIINASSSPATGTATLPVPSGEAPASSTPREPEKEAAALPSAPALMAAEAAGVPESDASTTPDAAAAPAAGTVLPDGAVIENALWTKDASPYVIGGDTVINGSLRIEPGVVVKLRAGAKLNLMSGSLTAGSADSADEVVFTSIADDYIGGDTNGDGGATDPDEHRWGQITIFAGTHADFEHARFRYAGGGATHALCHDPVAAPSIQTCYDAMRNSGVVFTSGSLAVRDSEFQWTGGAEILVTQGSVTLERDRFDAAALALNAQPPPSFLDIPRPTVLMRGSSVGAPIRLTNGHALFDFKENWWGTSAGPQSGWYTAGYDPYGDVSAETYIDPWLTSDPFGETADPCADGCASNVLFLPGIEGSRLYDADGKLWEPFDALADGVGGLLSGAGDARMSALGLGADGKSARADIYAKDGDILKESAGTKFYESFAEAMDGLKQTGTIADWKPIAYDWRLSLPDIVSGGAKRDGKIYYEEATDTPYIGQALRALAASSKTGRVTIVAHSNGGLVAKELMRELGAAETARLIDNVIFVGVSQTGAPQALGALLFGAGEGINVPHTPFPIVTQAAARQFALNAPMTYHLLPSQAYFEAADDPAHPVASFTDQSVYGADFAAFGGEIRSWAQLAGFLSGASDARAVPAPADTIHPAVANAALLAYANTEHAAIDTWTPPASTTVYQIAGWGEDTVSGVQFYDKPLLGGALGFAPRYRPVFVTDGDGMVTVPSALSTPGDAKVARYWLDLAGYESSSHRRITHGREFEAPAVTDFVLHVLTGNAALPDFISADAPEGGSAGRLRFILHGAGSIDVYGAGQHTSIAADGSFLENIPLSSAGQFGEDQYVSVPAGSPYDVAVTASSTSDLDIEQSDGSGTRLSTLSDIPLQPGVVGTLTLTELDDASDIIITGPGATTTVPAPPEDTATSTIPDESSATTTPATTTPAYDGTATSTDATSTAATSTPAGDGEDEGSGGGSHTSAASSTPPDAGVTDDGADGSAAKPAPKKLKFAKPVVKKPAKPKNKPPTASEIKAASREVAAAAAQTSQVAAAIAAVPPELRGALGGLMQALYALLARIASAITYLLRLIL